MKKLIWAAALVVCAAVNVFAMGGKEANVSPDKWPSGPVTVICPWAVGGVADVVNRKMATFGQEYLGQPVLATNELGAGGNVALTNYLKNQPNSLNLILGGEGAFSVSPNVPGGEVLQFTYDDYIPVINLYSAIFVMTGDAKLNIKNLDDLKAYAEAVFSGQDLEDEYMKYPEEGRPFTPESLQYRQIFEKHYPGQSSMIPGFWMPNREWNSCDVSDPSARYLPNYGASGS